MGKQLRSAHEISGVFSISPREAWCSRVRVFFAKRMACCGGLDMVPPHVFLSDFPAAF